MQEASRDDSVERSSPDRFFFPNSSHASHTGTSALSSQYEKYPVCFGIIALSVCECVRESVCPMCVKSLCGCMRAHMSVGARG